MLIDLFELASNSALEHGPKTSQSLQKLNGKTMVFTLKSVNQSIVVSPTKEGIEYSSNIPESVDVTLSATLGAILKISKDGYEDADLQPGEIEISGDPIIGQRFAKIIAELDIDWHSFFAEHIGESTAYWLSTAAEVTKDIAQQSKVSIMSQLNTLITDELDITANNTDVERFMDDVDALKADSERLALRLQRLQAQ